MATLDLAEPITLDDGEYQFVAQAGGLLRLRRAGDRSYHVLHPAELSRRVVGLPPANTTAVRLLENVSERRRSETLKLADHLQEVVDGFNPHVPTRPAFDPTVTTQEQRVQAKLEELAANGIKMGRSTFMAKLSAYKKHGPLGIIDGRATRTVFEMSTDRAEVVDAICAAIAADRNRSTGTRSRLIATVRKTLIAAHGEARASEMMPSQATMYRLLDIYIGGKHTTGSAKTKRSLAERPDRPFAKNSVMLPGAEVQLDSTVLDILIDVPGGDGKPERPTFTAMIDVATRSVLAYSFRLKAAKGIDHVALLAQALTPVQNQPDRSAFRNLVQQRNPGIELLDDDSLQRHANARPFIYPRKLVIDNGKDYVSSTVTAAAAKFGMSVVMSPIHTPTTKAHVERFLQTVATRFVQYLDGYVGNSANNRGYAVEKEKLMDIFALQELFHDWLLSQWQTQPHSGLRDPLDRTVKFSPNQMAAAAAELVSTIQIPLTKDDYIGMLPLEHRVVHSTGITFEHRQYDSPALHSLRGTPPPYPTNKDREWEIRIDPYNPSSIWVRGPRKEWIECYTRDWAAIDTPHFGELVPDTLTSRAEVATIGAALSGVPLHQTSAPPPMPLPTDFEDDDEDDDFTLTAFSLDQD